MSASSQTAAPLLEVRGLDLLTPAGRPLIEKLNLRIGREQAAILGRNGVGKSTLLRLLAGDEGISGGRVVRRTTPWFVPQQLEPNRPTDALDQLLSQPGARGREAAWWELAQAGLSDHRALRGTSHCSPGERRKLCLLDAKIRHPEFLILDEPTQDLDDVGIAWLVGWLKDWDGGLLVVSHQRRLLGCFQHFLVMAESGCRYIPGDLEVLEARLAQEAADNQRKYVRRLNALEQQEAHSEKYRRRRERKKNVGRVRELGRATPRMRLNQKRSYAQEKQGRMEAVRQSRLHAARSWAKAARRALAVALPLEAVMPKLPPPTGESLVVLQDVSAHVEGKPLFQNLSLSIGRERVAVTGANGAGKTSLLRIMTGDLAASTGNARRKFERIGVIAQGALDWMSQESLLERLSWDSGVQSPEAAAGLLLAHGFPLALAERPLSSLSPGERARAALVCLLQRRPAVELLVLDEPVHALDFAGAGALRQVLLAWPGGLVIASHDREFLESLQLDQTIELRPQAMSTSLSAS